MLYDKILDSLAILEEISNHKTEEVIDNRFMLDSMLWNLYVVIQGCIDLGLKVAAKLNLPTPETYSDLFNILARFKIIPAELKDNLISMAKFRNVLAHAYATLDVVRIHKNLKTDLMDIKKYLKIISQKLKELNKNI